MLKYIHNHMVNVLWLSGRRISLSREIIGKKQPHTCEYQALDIWINLWEAMKPPKLPGQDN
jgi:hypothetical protein